MFIDPTLQFLTYNKHRPAHQGMCINAEVLICRNLCEQSRGAEDNVVSSSPEVLKISSWAAADINAWRKKTTG